MTLTLSPHCHGPCAYCPLHCSVRTSLPGVLGEPAFLWTEGDWSPSEPGRDSLLYLHLADDSAQDSSRTPESCGKQSWELFAVGPPRIGVLLAPAVWWSEYCPGIFTRHGLHRRKFLLDKLIYL